MKAGGLNVSFVKMRFTASLTVIVRSEGRRGIETKVGDITSNYFFWNFINIDDQLVKIVTWGKSVYRKRKNKMIKLVGVVCKNRKEEK